MHRERSALLGMLAIPCARPEMPQPLVSELRCSTRSSCVETPRVLELNGSVINLHITPSSSLCSCWPHRVHANSADTSGAIVLLLCAELWQLQAPIAPHKVLLLKLWVARRPQQQQQLQPTAGDHTALPPNHYTGEQRAGSHSKFCATAAMVAGPCWATAVPVQRTGSQQHA